jgi:nucleoside-diphosphate-sugar epimerase
MKKILITGSEGFIGTHLKNYFNGKYEILGLDCKISIFHDIRYINYVKKIVKDFNPDIILHLAANPDVSVSTVYPQEDLMLNVNGTLNMLELAKEINLELFIFTSSACVYGETEEKFINEKFKVCPNSQYGVGKYSAEEYCRLYYRKYGVPTVVFRQFNMYGPNQNFNFAIPNMIRRIKNCKENQLMLYGTPNDTRDFTNVKDLCRVFDKIIESCPAGETFNIGSGIEYSIYEIAQLINKLTNKNLELYYENQIFDGKITQIAADNTKLKDIIDWQAEIKLEEGIKELINLI